MSNRIYIMPLAAMFMMTFSLSVTARTNRSITESQGTSVSMSDTDRDRDGLLGPVRRIKTETAKLISKDGKPVEAQRQTLETAAYDLKGSKIENAYFPISGASALTGNENYKYDDKGNISEMTLLNADGSLREKEVYTYEYDFVGNWTRMTTSIALIEGGKLVFEPTEVTYRTITYYLDETLAKMVQQASSPAAPPAAVPASNSVQPAAANSTAKNVSGPAQIKSDKPASALPPQVDIASLNKASVTGSSVPFSSPVGNSNTNTKPNVVLDGEPPAKAAPKPLLKPVSGGVLNGKAVELPAPLYPEVAKRMRATGLVSVEVVIDADGKVISAKAVSGNSMLQQAAVQAALRARFSPTTLSGQPVRVSGVINYNFALGK